MPLPMSFLCLSPSYLCHIPSPLSSSPLHHFTTRTVHHEMTITTLLTRLLHRGLCLLFLSCGICLSVCLSPLSPHVCMFLSYSVSVYTSVFLFLLSSHSALLHPWVSLSVFVATPAVPLALFELLAAPLVSLSFQLFHCIVFKFSFPLLLLSPAASYFPS